MPTYNDTPQATEARNATQPLIRQNFTSISTTLDVNHGGITAATDFGKHIKVDLTNIIAEPTAIAGQLVSYNFLNVITGKQELYVKRNGETGVPITARGGTTTGWTYLPSGLILKWGTDLAAAGLSDYTFPGGAPAFTTIYSIQITTSYDNAADGDGFVRLNTFAAPYTHFSIYSSRRIALVDKAVRYRYLAIGV